MNQLLNIDTWRIRYDADLNSEIYQKIPTGAPEECDCEGCKRFIEIREEFYPAEFKELLLTLGIDYLKEAEVVTYGEPGESPLNGWYNFVGQIENGENHILYINSDFRVQIDPVRRLVQKAFGLLPIVMLEWHWKAQDFPKNKKL